jgi:hypothetical protein
MGRPQLPPPLFSLRQQQQPQSPPPHPQEAHSTQNNSAPSSAPSSASPSWLSSSAAAYPSAAADAANSKPCTSTTTAAGATARWSRPRPRCAAHRHGTCTGITGEWQGLAGHGRRCRLLCGSRLRRGIRRIRRRGRRRYGGLGDTLNLGPGRMAGGFLKQSRRVAVQSS